MELSGEEEEGVVKVDALNLPPPSSSSLQRSMSPGMLTYVSLVGMGVGFG